MILVLAFVFSDDYFGGDDSAFVVSADYSLSVAEATSINFHIGQTITEEDGVTDSDDGYIDYLVGVSHDYAGLTFDLSFVGTDYDDSSVEAADDRLVFSISKSL